MLISAAGAILGIALAWGGVQLLTGFSPANLPRLEEIRLDGTVIAFAAILGLVAALALSAIPLLGAAHVAASLNERGRGSTASAGRHRIRQLLMGGQVALALMLFVASGLLVRSFQNLRSIDPGFDPSAALTFHIGLPESEYPDTDSAVRTHHAILDSLSAIPGVVGASASTRIPLATRSRGFTSDLHVEGRMVPENTIPPLAGFLAVAGGYFETMGTPILRGRGIDRSDVERATPVAVVSEAFVRAYFPNRDPIGARVARSANSDWLTIIGMVADMPGPEGAGRDALPQATAAAAFPELYMPMSISGPQEAPGKEANGPDVRAMSYVVRSAIPPLGLLESVRPPIDTVDRNLALAQVRTLEDLVDGATAPTAYTMVLVAIAAAVALLLGVVGVYGVVAYIVSQRTNEIGVRLALGADPRTVTAMIVRQGGAVTAAGIAVGLAAALTVGRLIESLLYGITPGDPGILTVAALALQGVATLACWLPARRAARISPTEALRSD
jgi:predicted permease